MNAPAKPSSWTNALARKLFFRSLRNLQGGFLELACPEATYTFGDPSAPLHAMAVVHDERFFLRAVTGSDIGIGESYMDGDWTTPDLVALVRLCVRNLRVFDSHHPVLSALRAVLSRRQHASRDNSIEGSPENIRAHYDLGNDFYRLFLDERMVYSCAVYLREEDTLEDAQLRKLDVICRKLDLHPGDRVLEIGCGWGAFAIHAAARYGAHVTAVTISPAQFRYVTDLLDRFDVSPGSVHLVFEDYRKLEGSFDKIVSIEMFEAVGFAHYDEFFGACDRLLAPDGSMLIQTITIPEQQLRSYRKRVDWIQTYIFPGSELSALSEISRSLGRASQLSLSYAESLGLHYAQTLSAWRGRFVEKLDALRALGFDERFERMWDFYLGWCEGAFRERYINVMQILFAKNGTQRFILGDPALFHSPQEHRLNNV